MTRANVNVDPPRPPQFPDHPPVPVVDEGSPTPGGSGTAGGTPPQAEVGSPRAPVWLVATVLVVVAMALVLGASAQWMRGDGGPTTTTAGFLPLEELPSAEGGLVAAPRDPPEDADWSEERIREAFDVAFDESVDPAVWYEVVDAPRITVEQLLALSASCGPVSPLVESVDFTSPDDAFVRFRLVGSQVSGADAVEFTGGAVRRDGTWKVTGYTFDAVTGLADPACG
jgi:hypothetical protein